MDAKEARRAWFAANGALLPNTSSATAERFAPQPARATIEPKRCNDQNCPTCK